MSQVILYDLPSRSPSRSWSLNPWKTRMVLNYKGVDYKTEWVEYPHLAPKFKELGLTPNDPNAVGFFTEYSSPAIRYADGSYSMDSWKIVHELEKQYPTPPLNLDDPVVVKIRDHVGNIRAPLDPFLMPKVPRDILNPVSAEYFERTRAVRYGKPLAQLEADGAKEQRWEEVKAPAKEAADLLKKNGGPFFLGQTVSYADFIFVAFLQCVKRLNEGVFRRLLDLEPTFESIYEASKPWLEKED